MKREYQHSLNYFVAVVIVCALAIGVDYVNHKQTTGDWIYFHRFVVLGDALWSGNGYRYEHASNTPIATYPLWGYSMYAGALRLVSKSYGDRLVQIIQITVSIIVASLHLFQWRRSRWLIFIPVLFIPLFAISIGRWPDGFYCSGFLLLLWLIPRWLQHKTISSLVGIIIVTIVLVNMRSETLFFSLFAILVWLSIQISRRKKHISFGQARTESIIKSPWLVIALSSIIGILPWCFYTTHNLGKPLLTSTNGGLVFYTTLGQLPNNPWHRKWKGVNVDSVAVEFAWRNGYDAFSTDGNAFLWRQALSEVQAYPTAFVRKILFNIGNALWDGVYVGDNVHVLLNASDKSVLDSMAFSEKIREALRGNASALKWIPTALIDIAFRCSLIFFIIKLFMKLKTKQITLFSGTAFLIVVQLVFNLLWIGVLQYSPRHMTVSFLLLACGILPNNISSQQERREIGN